MSTTPPTPTPELHPAAEVGGIEAHDPQDYAKLLAPWDVRINQLSRGEFDGALDAIMTPGMILYEERWRGRTETHGATPSGFVTVGVHLSSHEEPFEWCGDGLHSDVLGCAAPESEIGFTSPERSHHAVLLARPSLLAQALGEDWVAHLCSHQHLRVSPGAGQEFGERIVAVVRRYLASPTQLHHQFEARHLQSWVLQALSRCVGPETPAEQRTPPHARLLAVRRAIEHADEVAGRTTAYELSLAAGVSQRTMEYAFRRHVGLTPGAYLRLCRLNGAHRELHASDSRTTTVTRVARRWGFSHPGRFGVLHHRHFDELPSHTLKRSGVPGRPALLHQLREAATSHP